MPEKSVHLYHEAGFAGAKSDAARDAESDLYAAIDLVTKKSPNCASGIISLNPNHKMAASAKQALQARGFNQLACADIDRARGNCSFAHALRA